LVAAANPCPCGFEGDQRRQCRCRPDRIEQYRQRLSKLPTTWMRNPRMIAQQAFSHEAQDEDRRSIVPRPDLGVVANHTV
jgi:predicted ATPase with chaperone activity